MFYVHLDPRRVVARTLCENHLCMALVGEGGTWQGLIVDGEKD